MARARFGRAFGDALVGGLRSVLRAPAPRPRPGRGAGSGGAAAGGVRAAYAGDFTGTATIDYSPARDGDADSGEVVWAWVPFEEDATRGKDRPVLVLARDGRFLLGLMLTSKDHDRDAAQARRRGRLWMDVGTGGWDRQGRPSEARLDRVLRLDPAAVRREGAALDRPRFDGVAARVRELHGWR